MAEQPTVETSEEPAFTPGVVLGHGIFVISDIYGVLYRINADQGTWEPLSLGNGSSH